MHNDCSPATKKPTIKRGSKEWDNAVKKMKEGGKGNDFRVESASDAKAMLKEARGEMNRYKQYTSDFNKGYEFHPSEAGSINAPHNDLPHIMWKDWTSGATSGKGHTFFNKPN